MILRTTPHRRSRRFACVVIAGLAVCLGASACAAANEDAAVAVEAAQSAAAATDVPAAPVTEIEPFHPDGFEGVPQVPTDVYNPFTAGEEPPDGFRQLLRRDLIAPVYDPQFVERTGVGWPDDEAVIGVDLGGEARAYPVGFLNRREIVVDLHRGIPTLVTW